MTNITKEQIKELIKETELRLESAESSFNNSIHSLELELHIMDMSFCKKRLTLLKRMEQIERVC